MGLSFSVPKDISLPPSLNNIFKEIKRDLNINLSKNSDLTAWARSGVLLLNAILSVEFKKSLSHKDFGWETFTNKAIEILSAKRENLVFMLWGRFARSKKILIDSHKHLILESPHPSPLGQRYEKFIGCGHFSRCNDYLQKNGISPINWALPI